MRKIVLDTSAIIKDPTCFKKFKDAEIFIPMTVIEELDSIKERSNEASAKARKFIRELDAFPQDKLLDYPGVDVDGVKISSILFDDKVTDFFGACQCIDIEKPDNMILGACCSVSMYHENMETKNVTLVSEDRNLRLKARFFGFNAEGVEAIEEGGLCSSLYIDDAPEGIIKELFASSAGVETAILGVEPSANKYLVLRNGSMSALARCKGDSIYRVMKRDCFGIYPKNVEQIFSIDALMDPSVPLVALTGKAGTGKTLLALAAAIEQRSKYRQIMIARPVIPMGKDIGYLPGDVSEKVGPYMLPLFDNLGVIKHQFTDNGDQQQLIGRMQEEEKLVIEPLTFIRGRSLSRALLIVDEAQNLTPHEVKTIVTRAGDGTKIVFTGDVQQIDAEGIDSETNGLAYLIRKFDGQNLFAHIELTKGERSELAAFDCDLL